MVYVCTRRGEAIERGIVKKNKVRFGLDSHVRMAWRGVACHVRACFLGLGS